MGSLLRKDSRDQLERLRKITKGQDIGDRVAKDETKMPNLYYMRNSMDTDVLSYEDFASVGNNTTLGDDSKPKKKKKDKKTNESFNMDNFANLKTIEMIVQSGKPLYVKINGDVQNFFRVMAVDVPEKTMTIRKADDENADEIEIETIDVNRYFNEREYIEATEVHENKKVLGFYDFINEDNNTVDLLRVGKWVKFGNLAGTVVGIEGDTVKVEVATEEGPKVEKVPLSKIGKEYKSTKDEEYAQQIVGPSNKSNGKAPGVAPKSSGFAPEINAKGAQAGTVNNNPTVKKGNSNPWIGPNKK